MKIRPLVVVAILGLLWLAGCATVTFKRGAGPGGAKADEDACRAISKSQAAYVECLRERGWMVAGKSVSPMPAATAVPTKPGAASSAPATKSKEMTPPSESPGRAPSQEPDTQRPGAGGARATVPVPPAPEPAPEPAATEPEDAPLDPKTRINVSSWWKLGGTAADLDRAIAACEQELGADHKPSAGATEVTVAMKDCLRAKKWFPVGGTGPR